MPSLVWDRSPEEAHINPHEYGIQEQFIREAKVLLQKLYAGLDKYVMKFHRDDKSIKKATSMLQNDAIDSLRDCLEMLEKKKHRLASRLFRDVIETLDLAAYFNSGTVASKNDLAKWYKNQVIPHRRYRDYIKKTEGNAKSEKKKELYGQLSKYTHRSYLVLLQGYSLGRGDLLVYDSHSESDLLVLPHTISEYFAVLAGLIKVFSKEVVLYGLLSKEEVDSAWESSLEKETVPRRFVPHAVPSN